MILDPQVVAFTGIAALLTVTPGSDTMLVVRSALTRGRRAGLLTVVGVCCGLFVHATLSALGLSVILVRSARAFEVVKLAGACYLVYLGVRSIWSAARRRNPDVLGEAAADGRRAFAEGLLNNVLNPKVAVFYLAFLPQFIGPRDPVLARSILLAGIHFVQGVVWLSFLTLFVERARRALARPGLQRAMEGLTGLVLVGFGVRLAAERR